MAKLGAITASLVADIRDFEAKMDAAKKSLGEVEKEGGKTGKTLTENFKTAGESMQRFGGQLSSIGSDITMMAAPLIALGGVAFASATSIDNMRSTIVKSTGASGRALDDLVAVAREVGLRVPNDFNEIGIVIGEINTRLGVTGKELESTSKSFLDFARVNSLNVQESVAVTAKMMNALGMEAGDTSGVLDKLTYAAQKSGISAQTLAQSVIDAGPAFEQMGFDLDRQIALFSQFEMAGARPEEVISSLNLALNKMAREGFTDAQEAFEMYITRIEEAPDILTATTISSELFGARVGGKVAEDIRAGRFEIDDFVASLQEAGGTLERTGEDSMTFGDELKMLKNEIVLLLEPLGEELIVVMREDLLPLIKEGIELVKEWTHWFSELDPELKTATIKFFGLIAALGPFLIVAGKVITVLGKIILLLGGIKIAIIGLLAMAGIWGMIKSIEKWTEVLQALREDGIKGAWSKVVYIMTRDAQRLIEWFRKVRDAVTSALDLSKKSSPSVLDKVRAGVRIAEKEFGKLGEMRIQPVANMVGELQGVGDSGGINLSINMAGANISSEEVAQEYAERIGDAIVGKLRTNRRSYV